MTDIRTKIDMLWDDNPVDVTSEANFIWSIANKLRGTYMPDKYGDVIIPMTILRRFECALSHTKDKVIEMYEKNPNIPSQALERLSGFKFYNVSHFDLKELQNESDKLVENFTNYLEGFSANVQDIFKQLKLSDHINTMDEGGCLLTVVKAFSELDLDPATYDSIKMGYIFENLIGRFFQNVDAGQYYTGRDIIKCLVSILTAEGSDDIFEDHKVITVCDQACGTGGMLSTAYSYLKHVNPSADVRLFGQEYMGPSYAIGLAEMLIKGQDAQNFRHADTFKEDCFKDTKMRFVIENPPFGTPWSGKDAKEGIFISQFENTFIIYRANLHLGYKKNELSPEDRKKITELYANFEENELVKIYDNSEFIYREYTVMQPLQRSYAITEDRIESMIQKGVLSSIYDEGRVYELENSIETDAEKKAKELKTLKKLKENKPLYDSLLETLRSNLSDKVYYRLSDFEPVIKKLLADFDKKIISKVIDGLSVMDKKAEIHKDKKGIIYDTRTKDTEIVKWNEKIDDYMAREVLPHIPDAKAFFEAADENATFKDDMLAKKVKIGAEIPFTRYFYKYQEPIPSEDLLKKFKNLEDTVREKIDGLF